jgi:hypothetical protein
VLQLNLNQQHDKSYQKLNLEQGYFNTSSNPVSAVKNTLAWARLDFDWHSNTALIEEVQSDWIRSAQWLHNRCLQRQKQGQRLDSATKIWGIDSTLQTTLDYCQETLSYYQDTWAEAMLWAAIDFLYKEIGLKHIFYHTEASGKLLKNIAWRAPPQSIYTDLPRKFCFATTDEMPEFIGKEKAVQKMQHKKTPLPFHKLSFI